MDFVRNVERLLHPLKIRLANMIVRGVVQLVDDSKKLQMLQIGGFEGGPLDEVENFQQYGFSSSPLPGAEVVAICPNGDRAHPLVVASGDRRHRPTGKPGGHVCLYHHTGAIVEFTETGDVVVTPAPGRQILLGSDGATEPLVTRSEFMAHLHPVAGVTAGAVTVPSGTPTAPITGTTAVRVD